MVAKHTSAKRKKFINNTIVHISLAILAVIWVFPIAWVVLTSFRAEKGSYVSTFLPQSYTLANYAPPVYGYDAFEFPENVWEHADHRDLLLYPLYVLCAVRVVLPVQAAL